MSLIPSDCWKMNSFTTAHYNLPPFYYEHILHFTAFSLNCASEQSQISSFSLRSGACKLFLEASPITVRLFIDQNVNTFLLISSLYMLFKDGGDIYICIYIYIYPIICFTFLLSLLFISIFFLANVQKKLTILFD